MKSQVSMSKQVPSLLDPVNKPDDYKARHMSIDEMLNSDSSIQEFDALSESILLSGRFVDEIPPHAENLVCTTYFTTKNDPQRVNVRVDTDDFSYIKEWYDSVVRKNLYGIVFIDEASDDFIKQYSTDNIRFIRCKLGDLSLNDERYLIYFVYLLKFKDLIKSILFTDGNDVIFNKDPFEYISKFPSYKIFVGRNNTDKFKDSPFNVRKIRKMQFIELYDIKANFWLQPIYNAGILGGSRNVSLKFLYYMAYLLFKTNSKENMNMLVFNFVIYRYFCPTNTTSQFGKLLSKVNPEIYVYIYRIFKKLKVDYPKNKYVNHANDYYANTELIATSYPLHNAFKSFKHSDEEYIFHK